MMVLHPGQIQEGRTTMQKAPLRRRRSKGTIAGFASGKTSSSETLQPEQPGDLQENLSGSVGHTIAGSVGGGGSGGGSSSQPQHATDSSLLSPNNHAKPCHSAHLALLCCQNAILLGARTQLVLCPPGRARRELQAALRHQARSATSRRILTLQQNENSSYFTLDKMLGKESLEGYEEQEEDYLITTNTFDVESDEEASSGDEDQLRGIDSLFSEEPRHDEDEQYLNLREPLFTPIEGESLLSNPNGAPMSGTNASGKLPFNRRKIRYFDSVTAAESTIARSYLKQESRRSKRRSGLLLGRHLKKVQREARRKKMLERGGAAAVAVDDEPQDVQDPEEKALLRGVGHFETEMTCGLSAALLLESLKSNPLESLEGMSKCYGEIVAAGVALLDAQAIDPMSPDDNDEEGKTRPSRSEIMAALAPVLITSLEPPSGETVLLLAKLRRNCGTARYQRRFVQRVAPCLIRPPRGAMWCLRHQNDMEAILAAAELIFDSAFDIFSKGWFERGQLILADSKRAETLNTAAMQLRYLSSEPQDHLALGLSGHGNRRRLTSAVKKKRDSSGTPGENLAEWEVIAVDLQIRVSISSLMATDWSRTTIQSEIPRPSYRRGTPAGANRPAGLPQAASGEMSPKSIASSPRSPARAMISVKTPVSPPHMPPASSFPDTAENVFGPSFATQSLQERASSPPPSGGVLPSPPIPHRKTAKDQGDKSPPNPYSSMAQPPKSPRSPHRAEAAYKGIDTGITQPPVSPKRGGLSTVASIEGSITPSAQSATGQQPITPLSPSSVGTSTSGGDIMSYKPSSVTSVSVSSVPGQTAQYRTLTSTAAERKRTVAACRALRAQITRFEDAFVQLHGRSPKGAAERAPLATTYAQYREWKRAIRADAACRIQALFRGASARWMLLRMNNARMTHVVMTRAGRSGYVVDGQHRRSPRQESVINQLSIPVEIGQSDQDRGPSLTMAPPGGAESFSSGTTSLAPQWASKVVRRRSNSGDRASSDGFASSPAPPLPVPTSSSSSQPTATGGVDLVSMTLPELHSRKRELKQQLKQYDMNFARRHGRMPVKAEKEPIRHLYEGYNSLKTHITNAEVDGGRSHQSPVQSPASSPLPQRTVSPSSDSLSDDSPAKASPLPARAKRKLPKAASSPTIASMPALSGPPSQDLSVLKVEKGQLHQMLRSYEKDFYREHKRQVSSFADIKPVASQYRRYKEIKKAIAALQSETETPCFDLISTTYKTKYRENRTHERAACRLPCEPLEATSRTETPIVPVSLSYCIHGCCDALQLQHGRCRPIQLDLFRYCCLFIHGGVYADIDILLEDVELDSMIDASVGFMVPIDTPGAGTGHRHCVWNGFLAAAPGHPFLAKAIETVVNQVRHKFTTVDIAAQLCPNSALAVLQPSQILYISGRAYWEHPSIELLAETLRNKSILDPPR